MGYSLLYEYGMFRQKLVDGWQTELPDSWLPGGGIWLQPVPESCCRSPLRRPHRRAVARPVPLMYDHKDYTWSITAMPYDLMHRRQGRTGHQPARVSGRHDNDKFDMKLCSTGGNYMRAMEQQAMSRGHHQGALS